MAPLSPENRVGRKITFRAERDSMSTALPHPEGFARESHQCFWIKVFKRIRTAAVFSSAFRCNFPTEKKREREREREKEKEREGRGRGYSSRCTVVAQRSEYLDRSGAPGE